VSEKKTRKIKVAQRLVVPKEKKSFVFHFNSNFNFVFAWKMEKYVLKTEKICNYKTKPQQKSIIKLCCNKQIHCLENIMKKETNLFFLRYQNQSIWKK
jgi:hypothetical protein